MSRTIVRWCAPVAFAIAVGLSACVDKKADTLAEDTGSVTSATLDGPDGQTFAVDTTSADIPDADPDGLLLFFSLA